MKAFLRNLKESDIDILYDVENDEKLWKFSDQKKGFSRKVLREYIKIASIENLYVANQKRFVIESFDMKVLGFIDLFDYDKKKKYAYVGIVILKNYRNQGIGKRAIYLLQEISQKIYGIRELRVNIDPNNKFSLKLFEKCGFKKINNSFKKIIFHD